MKDLMSLINIKRVLSPVATPADNTAQVGQIIDRRGFESLTYLILTGAIPDADATFTVLLEESDDPAMAGAVAVADADLIGTEALASFLFNSDDKCFKLGYRGIKRYTRLTITPALNASATLIAACAVLGHPIASPTVNPPA